MNLLRFHMRSHRSGTMRPSIERLDDRIVPDTTGVTAPTTNPTTGDGTTPAATGTSSTSETNTTTGPTTTTTTNNGTTTTTTTTPTERLYAVGADAGNAARVRVYDNTGAKKADFLAYTRSNSRGGVRVAMGDVSGDGVADIITAPGPGSQPFVKVFDGLSGQELLGFHAYDPNFRGGVFLALGDINGDGRLDIVTGAGDGGGAHVKVFDGRGLFPGPGDAVIQAVPGPQTFLLREFFAYDAQYLVGARVAVADVNGDGTQDIITSAGINGGPHVRVFSGADGTIYREWFAYDPLYRGGVFVAGGDLNGDGNAEVVTGMGINGIGQVKVFDGRTHRLLRTFVSDPSKIRTSARLGVFDYDMDGDNDVVVSMGNKIDAFDGRTFVRVGGLKPFDGIHYGGVFFG